MQIPKCRSNVLHGPLHPGGEAFGAKGFSGKVLLGNSAFGERVFGEILFWEKGFGERDLLGKKAFTQEYKPNFPRCSILTLIAA